MSFTSTFKIFGPNDSIVATELGDAIDVTRNPDRSLVEMIPSGRVLVGAFPFDRDQPGTAWIPQEVSRVESPSGIEATVIDVESLTEKPDESEYLSMIQDAVDRINDGQMSKIVLARSLVAQHKSQIDVDHLLASLVNAFPSAHNFPVPERQGAMVGASPELLMRKRGREIETFPLAGSAPRSDDPTTDEANARKLFDSADRRHEHRIVVDQVAEALRGVSSNLQVPEDPQLFKTERIWHLGTPIKATLDDDSFSSLDLAHLLHPTAAVGGEPRRESAKAIEELESIDRGLYAGFIGWMDDQGDGEWFLAIRCARVEGQSATLFGGSGIVGRSVPAEEYLETGLRFTSFIDAVGWQVR